MKLALFDDFRVGLVSGSEIRNVTEAVEGWDNAWPWPFVPRLIGRMGDLRGRLEQAAERARPTALDQVRLRAPLPSPSKIVAAAANDSDHHAEMGGGALQGEVFLKAPSSIVGHNAVVALPHIPGRETHYEAELGVVIGRPMRNVGVAEALNGVFGYTILLDLTVRGAGDRSRRKSYDGFTPVGPWLVSADEVPEPQNLAIRLWRSGELRQDGNSRDMTYSIAEMLSYASSGMTLFPGDLLATGTPAGVGLVRAGDTLEVEIERVGRLAVSIAAASADAPVAEPRRRLAGGLQA